VPIPQLQRGYENLETKKMNSLKPAGAPCTQVVFFFFYSFYESKVAIWQVFKCLFFSTIYVFSNCTCTCMDRQCHLDFTISPPCLRRRDHERTKKKRRFARKNGLLLLLGGGGGDDGSLRRCLPRPPPHAAAFRTCTGCVSGRRTAMHYVKGGSK
jgi:hypothetical protein